MVAILPPLRMYGLKEHYGKKVLYYFNFYNESQAHVFCFPSCLPLKHHTVTTPTLLLWGEKNAFMEVEMAETTKIYVKNYFRLTILSEVSHWLQQEQPDIVNKLIWTFLKEETRKKD